MSQTGQQYSSLLLTIDLNSVIMTVGERSLNTLNTHEAIVLALFAVRWICSVHERSFEMYTPRSLTTSVGRIV